MLDLTTEPTKTFKERALKLTDLPGLSIAENEWFPMSYFPYRSLILGTWMYPGQWMVKMPEVKVLYDEVNRIIKSVGYEMPGNMNPKRDLDYQNYCVELSNRDNVPIYIGLCDRMICVGDDLMYVPKIGKIGYRIHATDYIDMPLLMERETKLEAANTRLLGTLQDGDYYVE